MGADKFFAVKNYRRISESTLMFFTIIGGSFGSCIAMLLFNHKTRHNKFKFGIPFFLIIHSIFLLYIITHTQIFNFKI